MRNQTIAIIGGTGFIGGNIACELARRDYRIRVISRRRERNRRLLVIPRLELLEADVHSAASLSAALHGCDAVINATGILQQRSHAGESFADVHQQLPEKVAEAARFNRIKRVLHISALGADENAPSEYLTSKAAGEELLQSQASSGMEITSFRPSAVFGPGDGLFSLLELAVKFSPFLLPLAGGNAQLSPVYVNDVSTAVVNCINDPQSIGQRYELCGPRRYTLVELAQYVASLLSLKRHVIALPDSLANIQAQILGLIPGSPLSPDSLRSLRANADCESNGLEKLGITPNSVESILPSYLNGGLAEQQFRQFRTSAGR